MEDAQLREEIVRLGPWKFDIRVTESVRTGDGEGADRRRERWHELLESIYPGGLDGRSFLDCACDCGAYSFWTRAFGAGRCFGFDDDERAIEQARFIREHRSIGPSTADMDFEALDVHRLHERAVGELDVARVAGLLHRVPDPIRALRAIAERTRELIVVATPFRPGLPDGHLAVRRAGRTPEGGAAIGWYPTGPRVLAEILRSCGFPETRVLTQRESADGEPGRLRLVAAREASVLAELDRWLRKRARKRQAPKDTRREYVERFRTTLKQYVPRFTTVVPVGTEHDEILSSRRHEIRHLANGSGDASSIAGGAAIARLEELRGGGAEYLVVPATELSRVEQDTELHRYLVERTRELTWRVDACAIFKLEAPSPEEQEVQLPVVRSVAPDDVMYRTGSSGYFRFGRDALRVIHRALAAAGKDRVEKILDLPCGHGRVARYLVAAYPEAELTACDIGRSGVDFCAEVLGAKALYSVPNPQDIECDDAFDLIWVGSLVTHLGADGWDDFLAFFAEHLVPGGVLVFTTAGAHLADAHRKGKRSPLIHDAEELLRDYDTTGFGYQDYVNQEGYGISLATPEWVAARVRSAPGLRLVSHEERGWLGRQDVVAAVKQG